jgi:signal transduction histidine kinase/ActR/RegA family two-component response regulator
MTDLLHWLLSSQNFMPHGHCYLWQPGTLWLNVGPDALIAASYYAIPLVLYYFVRHRKAELSYAWVPLMFAAFIFLCGSTHAMEIWTVWHPDYRLAGALKLLTGLVSLSTLIALMSIMPRAMMLSTPIQLQAEVKARTADLAEVNARLRAEIDARDVAQRQLRDADRRKDEFLATLAHELRNPLAPIRNSVKLLGADGTDETQRQFGRDVISRQVHRMALLLDDLLDVSRITLGRLELRKEPVDLNALIDSAVETARPLIEVKKHSLTVDVPAEPVTVEADPLRLSQVLSNLLTNAAKYTDDGGRISLHATVTAAGLVVSVADNGIGFEADAVPRMFEMFTQVESAIDRAQSGLGIGLALVKGLVDLHGGTVRASSAGPGRGAEFIVSLPASALLAVPVRPNAMPADARRPARRARKLLVADDNRDSADSLGLLLEMSGYDVRVAHTGARAMQAVQDEIPDAAILDIGMPDMNGHELARWVRSYVAGRPIALIAMTGWGQAADKERARAAGFDHHLTKPVDPDELERLLEALLGKIPVTGPL